MWCLNGSPLKMYGSRTGTYSNEWGPCKRKKDTKDGCVKVEIGVVFSQTEGYLGPPEPRAGGEILTKAPRSNQQLPNRATISLLQATKTVARCSRGPKQTQDRG